MSRRRVSVKDLGQPDCQGWLHRRREGRSFLSSRWKKFWFVLKESSLYWYSSRTAENAEGFISLSGFAVEEAKACRRKHALSVSHPQVVTVVVAAESFTDMNKWISKLSEAVKQCDLISSEDCYSEDSNHDDDECEPASLSLDSQLDGTNDGDGPQPPCDGLSQASTPPNAQSAENRSRTTSMVSTLDRRRRRAGSSTSGRLSWLDLPTSANAAEAAPLPLVQVQEEEKQEAAVAEKLPDEMENLYNHLRAARLSPVGRSSQRDFRGSFIRRSRNDQVNEKAHLLRILSSTLKAKELELLAVEQILDQPALTGPTYREWKRSNSVLLQEISRHVEPAGGAAEPRPEPEDV